MAPELTPSSDARSEQGHLLGVDGLVRLVGVEAEVDLQLLAEAGRSTISSDPVQDTRTSPNSLDRSSGS
ncbi:hypothetical protein ACFV8Z_53315 [Streptomyces sp. NPDC059837]|uniref:hypothetical protein n=1 Tax=Streptomyces sp. NPDC059837 TaxID=3346968 RepID=UPI003668CB77